MNESIIDLIEEDINTYFNKPIEELEYHVDREYDEYTVGEFLILYKIKRQFDLNVISKEEYDSLMELFETRWGLLTELYKKKYLEIINLMCSCNNDISKNDYLSEIESLKEKINGIDCVFKSYYLDEKINLTVVIDSCIRNEKYGHQDIKTLKEFYTKTKRK